MSVSSEVPPAAIDAGVKEAEAAGGATTAKAPAALPRTVALRGVQAVTAIARRHPLAARRPQPR